VGLEHPATRAVVPQGARGNALTTNPTTSENTGTLQAFHLESGGVMKELLSKWASLEKGRCRESDPGTYDVIVGGEFDAILGGAWESVREPDEGWAARSTAFQSALLQAAVQEAIAARSWDFDLSGSGYGPTYRAYVERVPSPVSEPARDWWCYADTPAEALLQAYLTALVEEAQG
jgi:hypothetical protein